eukprot:gnl/Spiro4/9786_TR5189_c0_g2_i4.p1 gnl/Spiro4/9786_TR5189_c0_g2~~gnl/Spiro4/9786_TR5189_c0_g2_i4.p1  ORF type:complete len:677 (-),score=157.00 gnl/Spiro4/9786_TR5189_c0_g2_i4:27-1940(-)
MVLARMNEDAIKGKLVAAKSGKFELTEEEEKLARSNYAEMKFAERMATVTAEALQSYVSRSIRTINKLNSFVRITEDDFFPLIHDATRFGGLDTMLDEFLWNFRQQRENGEPPLITDARGATLVDTLYYLLTQKKLHMSLPPPADFERQNKLTQEGIDFFRHVGDLLDADDTDMFETLGRIHKGDKSAPRVLVDEVFLHNFETLARNDQQEYQFRRAALTVHSEKFTREGGRFRPKPGKTVKQSIKFVIPVGFINGINPFNQINAKSIIENLVAQFVEAIPTKTPSKKELLGVSDCVVQLKEIENKKFSVPVEYICIATKKVLFDGVVTRLRQSLSLKISHANIVWMHPSDAPLTEENWGDYDVLAARLAPRYPSEEQWVDVYRRLAPCRDQGVFKEFPAIAVDRKKFLAFGLNNIALAFKNLGIMEDHSIFIPKSAKSFSLLAMMYILEKKGRGSARTPTLIESNERTSDQLPSHFTRQFKDKDVVVIDDVAGSGVTLSSACFSAFKWGAKSCSVAPIIFADAARKHLEIDSRAIQEEESDIQAQQSDPDKKVMKILDKQAVPVESVDYNEDWMGAAGYRGGKYFVFFPYMVPDNNVYVANMVLGQEFTDHSAIKLMNPNFMPKKLKAPECLRAGL